MTGYRLVLEGVLLHVAVAIRSIQYAQIIPTG